MRKGSTAPLLHLTAGCMLLALLLPPVSVSAEAGTSLQKPGKHVLLDKAVAGKSIIKR